MKEIRFHGRGGQGSVTAAELLAQAAIAEGKYAQAFPTFGPERRGAPIMAFLRISDEKILLREPVHSPDVVVVLDATLLDMKDICHGLALGGTVVVNAPVEEAKTYEDLRARYQIVQVDATTIAMQELGIPIVNTAIIGAVIKATQLVDAESLRAPFTHRFNALAQKNLSAMQRGVADAVLLERSEPDEPMDPQVQEGNEVLVDSIASWMDLELGGDIARPGSSEAFLTGGWRSGIRPVTDQEKCIKCGLCWLYCPDMVYHADAQGFFLWDGTYCKGCGICAEECPKNAIEMKGEAS